MRSIIRITLNSLFFFTLLYSTKGQDGKKENWDFPEYVSLEGKVVREKPVGTYGNGNWDSIPLLRLVRTRSTSPKGTLLLLIAGENGIIMELKGEMKTLGNLLDTLGYNTVIPDYSSVRLPTHDLALRDALKAFRLLKTRQTVLGLRGPQLSIMGISPGGSVAAGTVQKLGKKEQPDDLLLISPADLDEKLTGTVIPAVKPPLNPTARLFAVITADARRPEIDAASEYAKLWKGHDGHASFHLLSDTTQAAGKKDGYAVELAQMYRLLKEFLGSPAIMSSEPAVNPAAIPVAGGSRARHEEKLKLVAKEKYDLLMVGNSITNNFEKPQYQPVWNQFFAPRHALNLGFSGYRTENILWNLQHGELEGQSPKVVVLEIGTNNIDENHYPTRHTAGQLAGGIEAIVKLLRQKLPDAKIIVLRCFPGCYGGPNPTSHRAILERASDIVSRLADNKHIFYCDVNHVFLHLDGSINHEMMPDWLHPSPAGSKAWAQAMEPLLSQLMGDSSLDTEIPANTAIVPVSKLENDSYDWWDRHSAVLRIKDSVDPEIVLIGNSITHFWGGLPRLKYANGQARQPNGPRSWAALFDRHRVLNLGFGWDRTQNVLWRLDHGELDDLHPRLVIIDIGTNNTSQTEHARMNTAPEIVEGIRAVCGRVRSKTPGAKIVLMAIFPREQDPSNPRRILINETNRLLETFAKEEHITLVNIGARFLGPDGRMLPGVTSDFTHPTDKGYGIWVDAIRPLVEEP